MKITSQVIRLTFLGGAFGTLTRFFIGVVFGDLTTVVVVNLLGAALIGWLDAKPKFSEPNPRAFWITGFAGGFTTMSGVATIVVLWALASGSPGSESLLSGGVVILLALGLLVLGVATYLAAFRLSSKSTGMRAGKRATERNRP